MKNKFPFQQNSYSCGVHSVRNCTTLLGIEISYEQAKKITGAKSYSESAQQYFKPQKVLRNPFKMFRKFILRVGTSEKGIMKGLSKLGLTYKEFYSENPEKFLKFLNKQSGPVIMLVNYTMRKNDYGHWIVCASVDDGNYNIVDSAPWSGSTRQFYSSKKLLKRFIWYDDDGGEEYYEFYCIAARRN